MNIGINYAHSDVKKSWNYKDEMTDETFRSRVVCGREELLSTWTVGFTDKSFYMHKKLKYITN